MYKKRITPSKDRPKGSSSQVRKRRIEPFISMEFTNRFAMLVFAFSALYFCYASPLVSTKNRFVVFLGLIEVPLVWYGMKYTFNRVLGGGYSDAVLTFWLIWGLFATLGVLLGLAWTGVEPHFLFKFSYFSVGAAVLLFGVCLVVDVYFKMIQLIFRMDRRRVNYFKSIAILSLTSLCVLIGSLNGPFLSSPVLNQAYIHLPNLSPALSNFTILHLSDLYLGPFLGKSYLQHTLSQISSLQPSMIVMTGNIFLFPYSIHFEQLMKELGMLKPPYGMYYVTGTAEYLVGGGEMWPAVMSFVGIKSISNGLISVKKDDETVLDIVGLPDKYCTFFTSSSRARFSAPNITRALLQRTKDSGVPSPVTILIANNPSVYQSITPSDHIDIQLSGHTMGGMIFPFTSLINWLFPVGSGFAYDESRGTVLMVSAGMGYLGIPMRLGSQAEMTLIWLSKGPKVEYGWIGEETNKEEL